MSRTPPAPWCDDVGAAEERAREAVISEQPLVGLATDRGFQAEVAALLNVSELPLPGRARREPSWYEKYEIEDLRALFASDRRLFEWVVERGGRGGRGANRRGECPTEDAGAS